MKTREEVLQYGLSLPGTYQDAPFHDPNWQLIRVRKNKKAFLKQNACSYLLSPVKTM